MANICDSEVERYVEEHTSPFPGYMQDLARETQESLASPQMLTGTVEGRFLETLVFISGARRVLEVGTYSGYSALAMAQSLPDGGQIVSCELNPDHAAFARRHIERSPHSGRIEIREGPAIDSLAQLDGPFDLVFIDADKQGYRSYYEAVLPKLSQRGLIVADNTLWGGRVTDGASESEAGRAIIEFNDHVRDDPRVLSVQLTVRDGITLIRRSSA